MAFKSKSLSAKTSREFGPRRYLGIELHGAKNDKTAIAAIEYYPKEQKIFLLDLYDRVTRRPGQTRDQALLELLEELSTNVARTGVHAPLQIPPCFACKRKECLTRCKNPATKWVHDHYPDFEFTAYTQRPVEVFIREELLSGFRTEARFDFDETLGGSRAALTARMISLKPRLKEYGLIEVWPKLTFAVLSEKFKIPKRLITHYRRLESGAAARYEILELLTQHGQIFIYDRDLQKISENLNCFDAFLCSFTAYLDDLGFCKKPPKGFPAESGWVSYPAG